jgi:uncharacterized integral membrane protein
MRYFKIILTVVVLLLIFLLINQNHEVLNQPVQFKLNLWVHTFQSVAHPLWIITIFILFLGVLVTGLYSLPAVMRLRRTNRQLRQDLEILKSELQTCKPVMAAPVNTTLQNMETAPNP